MEELCNVLKFGDSKTLELIVCKTTEVYYQQIWLKQTCVKLRKF